MTTQIIRIGGTATVEIPEEMLRSANLSVGDPVEWKLTESGELALKTPVEVDNHPGSEEGYEEWKMKEIEAGIAENEAGKSIDGDRVIEWLQSWGTDHELPMPK
jgi:antitoxin component of MazEF toxin-antitoxin module